MTLEEGEVLTAAVQHLFSVPPSSYKHFSDLEAHVMSVLSSEITVLVGLEEIQRAKEEGRYMRDILGLL